MCIAFEAQPVIHFHQTTTLTPEQYVAGLTDFGPGRSKLFGNQVARLIEGAAARITTN